jgi:cytochrome c5
VIRPLATLGLAVAVTACGGEAPPQVSAGKPSLPEFADPHLAAGRAVWIAVCRGCHETGVGDAPRLGDRTAWRPRIAQGRATLHRHAIDGFFGPKGTMMPARGGNPMLADEQVKAAVDYMVAASRAARE